MQQLILPIIPFSATYLRGILNNQVTETNNHTPTTAQPRGQVTTVITTGTRAVNKTPKSPAALPQTTTPPSLESFPPPERFCESVELRDILWPQTQRGMLVERPCPKGTRGGCMYLLKCNTWQFFHSGLFELLSVTHKLICIWPLGEEKCVYSLRIHHLNKAIKPWEAMRCSDFTFSFNHVSKYVYL